MPILKKITIVTTFDKKFVIMSAASVSRAIAARGDSVANAGWIILDSHRLIPVSSEENGVDITHTTPAKIIAESGSVPAALE